MSKHRAGPIGDCPTEQCKKHVTEKHTPGPWEHTGVPHQSVPHAVEFRSPGKNIGFMVITHGTTQGWEHYDDYRGTPSYDEAYANAELIASAPDLAARCAALSAALTGLVEAATNFATQARELVLRVDEHGRSHMTPGAAKYLDALTALEQALEKEAAL